jgi:hypothetical protein
MTHGIRTTALTLALARAGRESDSEVGFHVGRGHSLHVTTLDIARKYAPPRQPRPTS